MLPVLCLCAVVVPGAVFALETEPHGDITSLFAEANRAYREARYDIAADWYEQIISAGCATADLYYNAGNAHYKAGALGKAIVNYRRALLLAPRDEDLQANLSVALEQTIDKIECQGTLTMLSGLCFWYHMMTETELCALFLVFHFLFWFLLAFRMKRPGDIVTVCAYLCLFFTLVFGISFGVKAYTARTAPEGVITSREVMVRAGTSLSDTVLFKLHEGTSFSWKEETEGWVKIELCDGKKGWIQKETAAKVSLS